MAHVQLDERRAARPPSAPLTGADADELAVQAHVQQRLRVVDERTPAGHPGREVATDRAENDDRAVRHVLAAVVADALDHRHGAGVPDGEALAGAAGAVELAAGRAVEGRVPDEAGLGRRRRAAVQRRCGRRSCSCRRSRSPRPRGRARRPRRETPRSSARRCRVKRARTRPGGVAGAVARPDQAAEPGADRAVRVHDLVGVLDDGGALERGRRVGCEPVVELAARRGRHRLARVRAHAVEAGEERREVEPRVARRRPCRADAAGRCGRSPRRTCAVRAQRGAAAPPPPRRAGTTRPARACASNFARSSGRCVAIPTGQVSTWHERTIRQPSASSSAVPKLTSSAPSSAATSTSRPVLKPPSARSRTRPRSPVETSACCVSASPSSHGAPAFLIDESGLAPVPPSAPATCTTSASALTTPAATMPDAGLGDELHRDGGVRVDAPQVEDQLREVLDRVDVVVRRRRDQRHSRLRVPETGDLLGHLVAGQLPALARLRALRDLDLELLGDGGVRRRDAEAARRRPA